MIRPRQDLEAIDHELEQLGRPRADIAELVTRYAGQSRAEAMLNGLAVQGGGTSDLSEDHDEFELLVEDEELLEGDSFEPE